MDGSLDKNPPSLLRYDDGERYVLLMPAKVADAQQVLDAIASSFNSLRTYMPWAHLTQNLETQTARLTETEASYAKGGDYVFHARRAADGPIMATIGLHRRTLNPKGIEVGYWVTSQHTGKGLATLLTRCLAVFVFDYFGYERFQCGYNEANIGSKKVNDRVGFREEGRFRNFEQRGTPEMIANGYNHGDYTVMTALFPEDRPALGWYAHVRDHLTVFDGGGMIVAPEFGRER